jgi:hypothetical protein
MKRTCWAIIAAALFAIASVSNLAAQVTGSIERLAQVNGGPPNNWVGQPRLSQDGRFVMFSSTATDLLPGVPPAGSFGSVPVYAQWYVFDRRTRTLERVSVNNQGIAQQGPATGTFRDRGTNNIDISNDGRYVVYDSQATNLVPNDTNDQADIFLFDRQTRQVRLVSTDADGMQLPLKAAAPQFLLGQSLRVSFCWLESISCNTAIKNLVTGGLQRFPQLASDIYNSGAISRTGTFALAFGTLSRLYLVDLSAGTYRIISVNQRNEPVGLNSPARISDDGSVVVFGTAEQDMLPEEVGLGFPGGQLYAWHAADNRIERVTRGDQRAGSSGGISGFEFDISADGRYVLWSDFDNELTGFPSLPTEVLVRVLYLRDLQTGRTVMPALDRQGRIASRYGVCENYGDPFNLGGYIAVNFLTNCPSISGNGKVLAFSSYSDLWSEGDLTPPAPINNVNVNRYLDVFVKDLTSIGAVPVPALNIKAMLLMALALGLSAMLSMRRH